MAKSGPQHALRPRATGPAGATAADPVHAAAALAPLIEAAAPAIDRNREIPAEVISALHEAGLFRLLLPRSLGGAEVDPAAFVRAAEALAKADASTAWCMAQTSVCSTVFASLDPQAARTIFAQNPNALLTWGPLNRSARAVVVPGGYRVTGEWMFASGSRHVDWLGGHCQVVGADGTPRMRSDGRPDERTLLLPKSAVTTTDTWQVMGLRGTGSDSYAITDYFVPEAHTMAAYGTDPAERREHGPLYRFTVFQLFGAAFAGIALGVARAATDAFVALAKTKVPNARNHTLRDNAAVQAQVGLSEARLRAARAFLIESLEAIWRSAVEGGEFPLDQRLALRMASTYAINVAKETVEAAYQAAGATAIFEANPFERRFRDIHAITQQSQGHVAIFETVGQHLLGLDASTRIM